MPDHSKLHIADPSQTLPVPIPAEEFWKRCREDAVGRALVVPDTDAWSTDPYDTTDRRWNSEDGRWSESAGVPDPSHVDADTIHPKGSQDTKFDWPESVGGQLPQTTSAPEATPWRPVEQAPDPSENKLSYPAYTAAHVAVAGLAVALLTWWAVG